MTLQKYAFLVSVLALFGVEVSGQCLTVPGALLEQVETAEQIVEGVVVSQQSFLGPDGNIYTNNHVEVSKVFKGSVVSEMDVVTEGGVFGDLMQVVIPSAKMNVGIRGVVLVASDQARGFSSLASNFFALDNDGKQVYGCRHAHEMGELEQLISRTTGIEPIELLKAEPKVLDLTESVERVTPTINSIYPLHVTAGTRSLITITGEGFGTAQGNGRIAFRNADDGGASLVSLIDGPHYVSWTDTEIQMYVPSATLYNTAVAGSGSIRVINSSGEFAESAEAVSVDFAKSEVIYSEALSKTKLVGMQQGGYEFTINQPLLALLGGSEMAELAIQKWACNTGVNFRLKEGYTSSTSFGHDDMNLFGLSEPGQLPGYLLGRTITTFSGCGTSEGLQWNLIEVDILLNSDMNWWTAETQPMPNSFDMQTAMLHELGHAHLLQHNSNPASPMYFELTQGSMRRQFDVYSDINGGAFVTTNSINIESTCGNEFHVEYDFSSCDLSMINAVEDESANEPSIYPNPFTDVLTVEFDQHSAMEYNLTDVTGRVIRNGVENAQRFVLQTADLPTGVYHLEVGNESGSHVSRLVKF